MFYEALKDATEYGKQKWISSPNWHANSSLEGLVLGGLAGGMSCALHTILSGAFLLSLLLILIDNLLFTILVYRS